MKERMSMCAHSLARGLNINMFRRRRRKGRRKEEEEKVEVIIDATFRCVWEIPLLRVKSNAAIGGRGVKEKGRENGSAVVHTCVRANVSDITIDFSLRAREKSSHESTHAKKKKKKRRANYDRAQKRRKRREREE